MDMVIDLRQALAGQTLLNAEEQVTNILVILHGRLRMDLDDNTKRDFAVGARIGMIEYLSNSLTTRKPLQ